MNLLNTRYRTIKIGFLTLMFGSTVCAYSQVSAGSSMAVRKPSRFVTFTKSAEALTLELLVEDFLNHRAFGPPNTLKAYGAALRLLMEFLSEQVGCAPQAVMFYDLSKPAVEAFRDSRLESEAPSTVDLRLSSIKVFTRFVAEKYQTQDKARGVRGVRKGAPVIKALKEPQYTAFRAAALRAPIRDRFIGELLLFTGIRNADACSLRISDIDEDWRFLRVYGGKSVGARRVPIPPPLRPSMMTYLDWRCRLNAEPSRALLVVDPAKMGRKPAEYRLSEKTVWRIIHGLSVEAGIPRELAHPHTLRHTYARMSLRMLSRKLPQAEALRMLQETLGHQRISTTMAHYLTHDEDEVYAAFAEMT